MKLQFSGTGRTIQPRETLKRRLVEALSAAGASDIRCGITEQGGALEVYGTLTAPGIEVVREALAKILRNPVVAAA